MVRLPNISQAKDRPELSAAYMQNSNVYELKLRKKLLQQQLSVIDSRCQRVAGVLEKKARAAGAAPGEYKWPQHNFKGQYSQEAGWSKGEQGSRKRPQDKSRPVRIGVLEHPPAREHKHPEVVSVAVGSPTLAPEAMVVRRRMQLLNETKRKAEMKERRAREKEREKVSTAPMACIETYHMPTSSDIETYHMIFVLPNIST